MTRVLGSTAAVRLPLTVLAAVSACSAPEPDRRAEATVTATGSALEEETTCHEGASPPPLMLRWSFDTQAVLQRSAQTTVELELRAREDLTVDLRLVSEGLDARRVSRDYGSYALEAGEPITVEVPLADLPLQAVSHSAMGTVETTITRTDGTTVTMHAPPFQHHFSPGYEAIVTYPYHAMIEEFHGGQISEKPSEVEGRVYIDGEWRDVDEQRLIEHELPIAFAPAIDIFLPEPIDPLPGGPGVGQRLCVDWRTQYIDAAHGEDVASTHGIQAVDASHALVTIEKVVDYGCTANSPGACGDIVWEGALDSAGCTLVPDSEAGDHYFVWLHGRFAREIDGSTTTAEIVYYPLDNVKSLGVPAIRLSVVHLADGFGSPYSPFEPPYPEVDIGQDHLFVIWREWQNAAAVMSLLLESPFITPGSSLTVHANRGCPSIDSEVPDTDACQQTGNIYTGPWAVTVFEEPVYWTAPGTFQYKYVLAHEAGHAAMHGGSGTPWKDYDYSLTSETSCRCKHVKLNTNREHCLQSIELSSTAQVEGFGHFVAASLFNDPEGSDCHFNYYKEFRGDDGTTRPPPYSVDCRNPVRWRDNHCFFHEQGTEYDWMQFYWNVNTVGTATSTAGDLFTIYQNACGGWCDPGDNITWTALDNAAQAHFGPDDPRYITFVNSGNDFGVDEDP